MSIQPLDYAQWYTVSNFLRFYSGHEGVVTLVFSEGMVRPIASMDIDAWMIFSTMCSHPTNLANAPPAEEGEQDDADPDDRQPLTAVEGNVEQMWPNEAFARPVRKGTGKSKGMSSSCKAKAMPSKSKGSGKDKDKDKDKDKGKGKSKRSSRSGKGADPYESKGKAIGKGGDDDDEASDE
eukprot:TRINITY_DN36538_c0_g1_i1.p1 TRINITY_DN36538_c0_g1~~TRINITY_DN36538_c0_g1_i1.p1  ORF type:complete len:180 (+),score=65.91 TRINITY_DN36538_c0_g1_i1:88-627(+)